MKNNDVIEEIKKESDLECTEISVQENYSVVGFDEIGRHSNTVTQVITNITDKKKMFNLENKVDVLLNDCEGEIIRVKEILIKRYEKSLREPVIDEETGEILKDKEISMSTVLVDDTGKSYATGSKIFGIQLLRYLQMANEIDKSELESEGLTIKIIKKKYGDKGNKALSFELV